MGGRLSTAFVARLAPELRGSAVPDEQELAALVDRARREAPGIDVDPEAFVGHVAERVTFDDTGRAVIAPLHAGALWIALGCVTGNAAAIAAFETQYAGEIAAALRRSFEHGVCEEAELRLRDRLFLVGADDAPRLASYAGRGDLRSWLRSAAVRTAIDLVRAPRHGVADPAALDDVAATDDPLLAALKQRYRDEFEVAFSAAAAELTDRERTLLRYHFFDDLSIDEIGALYRVHRATAARWLAAIREKLFEETRIRLMERLQLVAEAEVDSVLRLIDSQLDLSVEAMIRS